MGSLLEALASYSQRHFQRMDRLARSAFLLDYTLGSIKVYLGEVADSSAGRQPGDSTVVGRQSEGGTGAEAAARTVEAQPARPSQIANGHVRPHEQTNGHSHPQPASSSDAEFGGHDVRPPATGAAVADIREPVHLGNDVVDNASTQQEAMEQAAPKRRVKRKRHRVDGTPTHGERGDDFAEDAVRSDAPQDADDDAGDDTSGDAELLASTAGQPGAPGSSGADGAGSKRRGKKKKKKKRKAPVSPPADASSAIARTADAGIARKAKRTLS